MNSASKHALVIGASRGLGLGLVKELRARGWAVTATVRDAGKATDLKAVPGVAIETVDIDNAAMVEALLGRLDNASFDLVFVNAGIMGPRDRIRPRGVLTLMTSQLGSVANNSTGGTELYRASKAALNTLTRSFYAGVKDTGLTVISMHPGWVRTDMGGENAPLDVATSARGMVDQIERLAGSGEHVFIDYKGMTLPW